VIDSSSAVARIWADYGHDPELLDDLDLTGKEPVLPSSFAVSAAAQTSIALSALAAASIWRTRTGRRQRVGVDMRAAAAAARSERYLTVADEERGDPWDKIAGAYQCGDGRYVRLHTNFPHHRDGVLKILGCAYDRAAVAQALQRWKAIAFEDVAAQDGLAVAAMRTFAEWDQHPQSKAIAALPLLSIEKIGDAPPPSWTDGTRPLAGVRVLDLTRVIAGPVCGRTLAAHGADVMLVTAAHLPQMMPLVIDSGRGKLSTFIDLGDGAGRETLAGLMRDADIFVQGYRPGAIAGAGFGPEQAAALRPGIVCVSLCAYGHEGPWARRRGFDSLVQNANGLNHAEAEAAGSAQPKPLPAQALDHAAGYLMAFGAMTALARRATEGGSWHVRVSLAQTGRWIRSLGRVDGLSVRDPGFDDVRDRLEDNDSGFGRLTTVRHAATMSETPPRWARPSVPLGYHEPVWPARTA
jgi:crotonobetainyl-CoA:carnitine CoA-transferase CaiB-like acyl-CoA transferase